MNLLLLRILLIGVLILRTLPVSAQNAVPVYEREITISEMFEEIKNCKEEKYVLSNTRILPDKYQFDEKLVIDIPIQISECSYTNTRLLIFKNITFNKRLDFYKTEDLGIFFYDCIFTGYHSWRFANVPNAYYENCSFSGKFMFFNSTGGLHFTDCFFDYKGDVANDFTQLTIRTWNKTMAQMTIANSTFRSDSLGAVISIVGNIDRLGLYESRFESLVDLSGLNAPQFIVQKCEFLQPVGFEETVLTPSQTDFKFSQIAGFKVALYPYGTDSICYQASDHSQLTDSVTDNPYLFNSLISVYSKLFNTYKYRGDRESANACYVEMKDIESRKLKYVHEMEPSFNNYLNYQLNCFLKYFADYGTNPTKSLSISIRVILLFSLIYFFFYSEWDRIDRLFLMKRFRGLLNYFRQDRTMEEAYHAEFDEERQSFEEFKKEIEDNHIHLPFFIQLLARPLYELSLVRHRMLKAIYRKAELKHRKWATLGRLRKWTVGTVAAFAITGYGLWLIAVRGLNSVVLSVNAFSTLGFGDIPVKGISRYIAILEGFLGWFLLSIFSVSLISQILQN